MLILAVSARALPYDKLSPDHAVRRWFTSLKPFREQLNGSLSHLFGVGTYGGERRLYEGRHLNVVEADDSHILGHPDSMSMQGAKGSDGTAGRLQRSKPSVFPVR